MRLCMGDGEGRVQGWWCPGMRRRVLAPVRARLHGLLASSDERQEDQAHTPCCTPPDAEDSLLPAFWRTARPVAAPPLTAMLKATHMACFLFGPVARLRRAAATMAALASASPASSSRAALILSAVSRPRM